MLKTFSSIETF